MENIKGKKRNLIVNLFIFGLEFWKWEIKIWTKKFYSGFICEMLNEIFMKLKQVGKSLSLFRGV